MTSLTDTQVDFIVSDLLKRGLQYAPLVDELIDHVCCEVEFLLDQDIPFHQAYEQAMIAFGPDGLRQTQINTMHLNRPFYRRLAPLITAIAACLPLLLMNVGAMDPPSMLPLEETDLVRVTSPFGERYHPIKKKRLHHNGIDFSVPTGTPVFATADGTIIKAGRAGAYGILIELKHDDTYTSRYAQLSRVAVTPGEQVKKGTVIGYSGNSGQSTAPHLHYEVIKDNQPVNPAGYFE